MTAAKKSGKKSPAKSPKAAGKTAGTGKGLTPAPKSTENWKVIDPKDAVKEIGKALGKKKPSRKSGKKVSGKTSIRARKPTGTGKSPDKNNKKNQIKEGEPTKKRGAVSKYDKDIHPVMGWMLAIRGKINKEIAAGLSISTATLDAWMDAHPEFLSAIKRGKDAADADVEKSLYTRACGYDYDFTETTTDSEKGTTTKTGKKHVAADVTAAIFWLCNRRKDEWASVNRVELTGPGGRPIRITKAEDLTDDELAKIVAGGSSGSRGAPAK